MHAALRIMLASVLASWGCDAGGSSSLPVPSELDAQPPAVDAGDDVDPIDAYAVVADRGPPSLDEAFASDAVEDQFNDQLLAEQFVVAADDTARSVVWWGRPENGIELINQVSFTVRIHADADGLPGAVLREQTRATADTQPIAIAISSSDEPIFEHHVAFEPVELAAGTYWVSIGATSSDPRGDGWFWAASTVVRDDQFAAQGPVGGAWEAAGFADLAFRVHRSATPGR